MKKRPTIRKRAHIKRSKRIISKGGAGAAGRPESRKKFKQPHKDPKIVKRTFKHGVQFEGRYLDEDETHLAGSFINPGEGMTYQGTAVLHEATSTVKLHGSGKVTWCNGETYEGQFRMGRKHGYGVYTLPNGTVYSGDFKNDIADGWGHLAELKDDGTIEHTTGPVIQQKDGTFSFLEDPMPPLDFAVAMGPHSQLECDAVHVTHQMYARRKAKDATEFASIQAEARRRK